MNSKLLPSMLMPGLLLLAFFGPHASASAQEETARPDHPPTRAEVRRYDADKDGRLNEEETAHMKQDEAARAAAREKRLLAKYDANHNGVLDPDEKERWEADRKADHERRQAQRAARQAARDAEKGGEPDQH